MVDIEKQAIAERIKDMLGKVREELAACIESASHDEYTRGVKQSARTFETMLGNLHAFALTLNVEDAEEYVAARLQERSKDRKQAKRGKTVEPYKHEQKKRKR